MSLILTTTEGLLRKDNVAAVNDYAREQQYQIEFHDGGLLILEKKTVLLIQILP